MTPEHRKSDILAQMLQNNVRELVSNLALAFEQRDALKAETETLKARAAELEQQLSPKPEPAPPS